jgi:ribulose bisphosphate carboxylase small subunit
MYRRVLSFLMVLVVLSVLVFFFSCSLSPRLTKVPTNEGSIADTTPPSVTITFPTNGQILFTNEITITGTASDEGSGVKEVWLSVNGGGFGKVNGTTSWSTNVTVNYGNNTIRVYAVDNSGNVSTTNTVSFVVGDNVRPVVLIVSPTNNEVIYTNVVNISGTASDVESGVKEVWLSVNGGGFGKVNGTTSWSTNVTVNYGNNTIRVYAVDNSGNVSTTNTVSFVVGDNVRPVVLIVSPTNNEVIYTNVVNISGTASDVESGVKEVWLSVNGGGFGKVNGTTSWSTNVTVNYGSNTISVYAVDNSNNVSATNTVSFDVVADTNKPSVSITTPTEGQVLYDNNITVSGTASDVGSGVKEVWLSVNGGGFGKVNGTTSWSTNVTVNYGSNTIRVYAVDNSGNVSTTNTVSVFRDYVVFVSTSGDDANSGGISDPFRSINVAMNYISTNITNLGITVEVRVGSGVYTPGSGLSSSGSGFVINRHNIVISGGWNSDFSIVVGKSELDGNGSLYHVVMITNVTNVKLENLVIRGGNVNGSNPDDRGGGIYVSKVSYLVIESNVVIRNNSANNLGGGLFLVNSTNTTIIGSVYSNSAFYGGGLYLVNSTNTTIIGSVYGNSANRGGGLYLDYSRNTTISGSVYSNSAFYGGGLYLVNSTNTTIIGSVYSNSAFYGGGLYLVNSTNTTIIGSVYGNSANRGGGLYLDYSRNTTISGSVYGNSANNGGGLFLRYSQNTTISSSVYSNSANNGGGLFLGSSTNTTISGSVYGNSADLGGGLYLDYSRNTTISGSVYGNSAIFGGGLFLVDSDYFTNTGWITNNTADSDVGSGGGVYRIGLYSNSYFGNVSNNFPDNIAP